jgi:hypothetical protein
MLCALSEKLLNVTELNNPAHISEAQSTNPECW